jgi:membrane fusion protein, multidrug efflux system
MPTEKSPGAAEDGSSSIPARPEAEAAAPLGNSKPQTGIPSEPSSPSGPKPTSKRRLIMGAAAVLGLALLAVFGVPWIMFILTTVSTDDAYVNGHVTFVAARVPGQVSRVLVDDNNRVNKGDLLVELDREPYEVDVAIKKAAVDTAKADLNAAKANVRSIEAKARSQRWNLQHAIEDVQNQIALLHAKVAALDKSRATVKRAEGDVERARKLVPTGSMSREEADHREQSLLVARSEVIEALDDIHQIRVSLGLPAEPENGGDLASVPPSRSDIFVGAPGTGRIGADCGRAWR